MISFWDFKISYHGDTEDTEKKINRDERDKEERKLMVRRSSLNDVLLVFF
jgi:hypothetical protein